MKTNRHAGDTPPALVEECVRVIPNSNSNNDDEDEEEMISLGLSRESSLIAISNSNEDDNATVTNSVSVEENTPAISMVGTNRKSTFPATPATPAMAASLVQQQQRSGPPMRRTPGPMSVAQQARHRRTPGAGHSHNEADLARSHARTPVMSGGSNRLSKTPHKLPLPSSSLVTPSNKSLITTFAMETPDLNNTTNNTPNNMNDHGNNNRSASQQHHQQRQLYTPAHFTLAKNADLHMENRPDALSPATLRMTDSLEKLLTDDEDHLEVKQRLLQQCPQIQEQGMSPIRKMVPNNNNVAAPIGFESYPKTQESYDPRTQDSYTLTQDDIVSGRGAFRRIQSTCSSDDSANEMMKKIKDLDTSSETGGVSSQEEEDEAEISQINDEEEDEDNDEEISKADFSLSRPKPVNFETTSGGAFEPPKALIRAVAVPTVVANEGTSTGTIPGALLTPKPQRTRPRPAALPYHAPQGGGGGQHPNQGQGGGMYYPPAQQQQGYFVHQGGGAEGMMGGHQHPAPNMLFGHEQHQQPPHLQYAHSPHHYQPQPHQQYAPHHQHPSQHFHISSMSSPRFGPMPPQLAGGGVVSPLTIPPDFSGAYHPHSHANTANVGGSYPPHPHHSMHTIPPDFGANQGGPPPGAAGDWLWRGDHTTMMSHGMHHPHPHDHLQQQGMGFPTMPGHASPDFSFHELSGAVSPFNMQNHHHPFPTQHANNYSRHHHQHNPHHQSHGTAAPVIHRPGTAGMGVAPSAAVTSSRHRTQSKEDQSRTNNNIQRSSSPSLPTSPMKQTSPGERRSMRSRKNSSGSSINSGAGSAFSGGGEEQPGGNISTAFSQTTAVSSPSASSAASVLRQAFPGLVHSASSEEQQGGPLELNNDWFYPSLNSKNNGASYSSTMDGSGGGAYSKQHKANAASVHEGYSQQQLNKGRGKKGNHHEPTPMMAMQNISGHVNINNNSRGKKASGKQQQQRDRSELQHQHHQAPHIDLSRRPGGIRTGGPYGGGGADNGDAKHHQQQRGSGGTSGEQFVMESPTERQAFKEFGRHFRQKENVSLEAAREYALSCLDASHPELYLPPATHWRVFLELADVAKRSNMIDDARSHYREACRLRQVASQGWLEHSKLEEECGNLDRCATILQEGLRHCTTNENLLIRAVKFYERMGDLDQARHLLSRTKHLSIDKSWKTVLEGALLEARVGRYSMAREVLKYLTHYVPWYGPLYLAHTKLERDYGSSIEAFSIVEKGLKELPRYGPLYFQAFRLLEKEDLSQKAFDLPRTMEMVSRADSISRELLWKVHLEAAQMQERAAVLAVQDNPKKLDLQTALQPTRRSYAKAIMLCPPNLSWKIWLASGRTEVSCGNTKGARDLFLRAYDSVSEKGRSTVLLECARLEEFCGDLALSRSILCKARQQFGNSDWKVWLSSVNLECRCGLRERAIAFAQEALNIHRGTGRLWAALIQLRHDDGELYQMKVLKCALQAVPKSGEVWCEGARIHLSPFSPTFDLQEASRHLSFAARFTPQYGDSFLEQLRLNMLDQWLIPLATPFINSMYDTFVSLCNSNNEMQIEDAYQFIAEHTKKAADVMKTQLQETKDPVITRDVLDTSELELRCSSADPNYGHLWFQCRDSAIDTAREVITQAKSVMADFVVDYSYLYIAAMVRRAGVLMLIHHRAEKTIAAPITTDLSAQQPKLSSAQGLPRPNSREWDRIVDKQLRSAPPLDQMLLSDSGVAGSMFTTGCGGNSHNWDTLSLTEKRRILFGSDSLLS
eukprot:CAMPEP_0201893392 /NCGR_PEP_ID=MMETSP0902-20130614/38495_1 /ASSEMBLY_ACC=CAM_ASM_000551 /TAXON_ID=420261 /ORGANISM="Thalassiosira antarctica, Strain CCMP982" /LENGTH=1751 /DNA_ID=CAMNT_0048425149 /DNA_START=52 /DNA_END=5307 /DNA_ORIENTATION=-